MPPPGRAPRPRGARPDEHARGQGSVNCDFPWKGLAVRRSGVRGEQGRVEPFGASAGGGHDRRRAPRVRAAAWWGPPDRARAEASRPYCAFILCDALPRWAAGGPPEGRGFGPRRLGPCSSGGSSLSMMIRKGRLRREGPRKASHHRLAPAGPGPCRYRGPGRGDRSCRVRKKGTSEAEQRCGVPRISTPSCKLASQAEAATSPDGL